MVAANRSSWASERTKKPPCGTVRAWKPSDLTSVRGMSRVQGGKRVQIKCRLSDRAVKNKQSRATDFLVPTVERTIVR